MSLQEQYVKFPRKLLESPVLRVLTANERRALDRILIEHQRHAGFVNEGLPVTQRDFLAAGVHRRHVTAAPRVLEKLGIIECTRRMMGTSSGRLPNLWRLTFLPTKPNSNDATHDYLKFTTVADAERAARRLRTHETRKHLPLQGRGRANPKLAIFDWCNSARGNK